MKYYVAISTVSSGRYHISNEGKTFSFAQYITNNHMIYLRTISSRMQ